MHFKTTELEGAYLIEPNPLKDHRGFFMRTFCAREFAKHGLRHEFKQHSTSQTLRLGSIRGMHFQKPPFTEAKVVTCLQGAILDIIIDLRPESPTHGKWQAFELTEANRNQLYVPPRFAHGFQTLKDNTEVAYLISEFYTPEAAAGVRHDDPAFEIKWPLPISEISDKDTSWPDYDGTGI